MESAFHRFELATHQLHVVAVHLGLVAKQWGSTAFLCEYWLERLMQELIVSHRPNSINPNITHMLGVHDFKRNLKLWCTRQPELTAFISYLGANALRECNWQHPEVATFVPSTHS